jgi:DnaJ-class molecular chaperone
MASSPASFTGGDAAAFVLLKEAYEALADPSAKRAYDLAQGYTAAEPPLSSASGPVGTLQAPRSSGGVQASGKSNGNPCGDGRPYAFLFGTWFCGGAGGGQDLHIVFG